MAKKKLKSVNLGEVYVNVKVNDKSLKGALKALEKLEKELNVCIKAYDKLIKRVEKANGKKRK